MPAPVLLEVCVETANSAVAAERGGAHRVELCANLAVEGLTPPRQLIEEVRRRISLPLHVLIRPRTGNFNYTLAEFESMKKEIVRAKQMGVNGLVFGILDAGNNVDVSRMRELIELSHPLAVTFHRAFDEASDLPTALEAVVQIGADRILTSGGSSSAEEGTPVLAELVKQAAGRVTILACGTIRETNVRKIVDGTGVREVHTSLLARTDNGAQDIRPEAVSLFLQAAAETHGTRR